MMNKGILTFLVVEAGIVYASAAAVSEPTSPSVPQATLNLRETKLGTLPFTTKLSDVEASHDNLHHCYVVGLPDHWRLRHDGREGPLYNRIYTGLYSPNGERLAYVARNEEGTLVVLDGKEGKPYERIADSLVFSPDSRHICYFAVLPGRKFALVLDGTESGNWDQAHSFVFSQDGAHHAYAALGNGRWAVIRDGTPGDSFDNGIRPDSIRFSPDSQRLGYVAATGHKNVAVVDGHPGKATDGIFGPLCFSPDSRHVAYAAKQGNRFQIVRDEKSMGDFEEVSADEIVFSPDSKHLAYIAVRNDKWCLVLDEVPGPEWDGIGNGSVVFSPNSQRVAYAAKQGLRWRIVVVNEGQGSEFDGIHYQWAQFSPDSRRMAYLASREGKWRLVLDGREGKPYDKRTARSPGFAFSPDSQHIAYFARHDKKECLVVDDMEAGDYEDSRAVFFSNANAVRALVTKENVMFDRELFRLDVTIRTPNEKERD